MSRRDLIDAIDNEIGEWPGVKFHHEHRAKHPAVIIEFAGQRRISPYPSSPSDRRVMLKKVCELRRLLTGMGAERQPRPGKPDTRNHAATIIHQEDVRLAGIQPDTRYQALPRGGDPRVQGAPGPGYQMGRGHDRLASVRR